MSDINYIKIEQKGRVEINENQKLNTTEMIYISKKLKNKQMINKIKSH